MDSVVESRKPAEQPFESQCAGKGSQDVGTFRENELPVQHENQSCGEMIFEGDEPDERGDHVVGSNYECSAVDVIWLAGNELDGAPMEKDSDFYPSVEVGANETATVIDLKACQTNGQSSTNPSAPAGLELSGLPSSPHTTVDNQSKPLSNEPSREPAHASSDGNIFPDTVPKQVSGKPPWIDRGEEALLPVSCADSITVNPLIQGKTYYTMNHIPSNILLNSGCTSMLGEGKSDLQSSNVSGYFMNPNSIQVAAQTGHRNGIITTNPVNAFQQHRNYAGPGTSTSYLTYPMVSTNRNMLPSYTNDAIPFIQQFGTSHQNIDLNSNVLPYQIGQRPQEEYGCHMNYIGPPGSMSAFEGTRDLMSFPLRQEIPTQHPLRASTTPIDHPLEHPFVNQRSSYVAQATPHCPPLAESVKITATDAALRTQDVAFTNGNRSLNPLSFQLPVAPSHPSHESANSLKPLSSCVDPSEQRDCCPPVLTPSTGPVQEAENQDTVLHSPTTSQVSSSCLPPFRSSAMTSPTVTKLEDVVVFKAPRRLGMSLMKYARCPKKRSHTIDVLVRNSVKNFELSTAVSSKTPLFPPSSPANIADDSVSREDRPRPRPYFPVVKFPNMLDVNFRRRPGTKTPSRPRHLCDQTREVIGRVCAYFREFSTRFASLGNNIAGTPFENPERMASHATGFALPTIRRCYDRMEVVPHCTYRPGSLPTDDELSNLSLTFADEPWFASLKARSHSGVPRKRTKKPSTPSPVSLSEMEKDPDESADEHLSEGEMEQYEPEEADQTAPKLRRSQRILNQRKAKMMIRLRTKKLERKLVDTSNQKDRNKTSNTVGEAATVSSEICTNQANKQSCSTVENKPLAPGKFEMGKKRCRRTSSPILSTDSRSDHDRRAVHAIKRSRSASRVMDCSKNDTRAISINELTKVKDDEALKSVAKSNKAIDFQFINPSNNDRSC